MGQISLAFPHGIAAAITAPSPSRNHYLCLKYQCLIRYNKEKLSLGISVKAQRKIFANLFLISLGIALAVGIAEFGVRQLLFTKEQRQEGTHSLWKQYSLENITPTQTNSGCSFLDSLIPHPHFGYVLHNSPPCGNPNSNNLGIPDRADFPFLKDANFFTIALLGGSVASHLAMGNFNGLNWIEDHLNKNYLSPNQKPFRVVSGAAGGWAYPNQIIFLALYGAFIDAAIAIDGVNESLSVYNGFALMENSSSLLFSLMHTEGSGATFLTSIPRTILHFILPRSYLRESFLAFYIFKSSLLLASGKNPWLARAMTEEGNRLYPVHFQWTKAQQLNWNKNYYMKYIHLLKSLSEGLGLKYAHFVQPTISIGKPLSEEEKRIPPFIDPQVYSQTIIAASHEMRQKGYQTESLAEIFNNETKTIYSDYVHCLYGDSLKNYGYERISEAIAERAAQAWKLKRKK